MRHRSKLDLLKGRIRSKSKMICNVTTCLEKLDTVVKPTVETRWNLALAHDSGRSSPTTVNRASVVLENEMQDEMITIEFTGRQNNETFMRFGDDQVILI
jgi:hypothetical protein